MKVCLVSDRGQTGVRHAGLSRTRISRMGAEISS